MCKKKKSNSDLQDPTNKTETQLQSGEVKLRMQHLAGCLQFR